MKPHIYIICIGILGYLFSGALVSKYYHDTIKDLGAQSTPEASINFSKDHRNPKIRALYIKKNELFNGMRQFCPRSHEGKTVFRLTIPFIMKLFNFTILKLYYIQIILGFLICILLSYISFDITRNYFSTALFTVGAACTYFVQASFKDGYIWGDTFAYFFILTSICFRKKPMLLILSLIALFFCDERGILVIPVIWVCIKILDGKIKDATTWQNLLSFKDNSIYLYIAVTISICLRLFISFRYGLYLPENGQVGLLSVAFPHWRDLQRGLFSGLESFWGIIFLTIVQCVMDKKFIFGIGLFAITCALSLTACMVQDITRSITYLLPFCFISLWYFKDKIPTLKKILIIVCSINLFYPSTIIILGYPDWVSDPYLFGIILKGVGHLSRILQTCSFR